MSKSNTILLTRGRPMKERVADVVSQWAEQGKPDSLLVTGLGYFALCCWNHDFKLRRAQAPDSEPALAEFLSASEAAIGGRRGWFAMLEEREHCSQCMETYRAENISFCVDCLQYVCYRCKSRHPRCEVVG